MKNYLNGQKLRSLQECNMSENNSSIVSLPVYWKTKSREGRKEGKRRQKKFRDLSQTTN